MPRRNCDHCGREYWLSNARLATASCCSLACKKAFTLNIDPTKRFDTKVEKSSGCWNWKAATNTTGYGVFGLQGGRRNVLAHVFSYERANGPVPDGLELDHLCRNPRCVNPAHLEAVTHRENMRRGAVTNQGVCRKASHPMTPENTTPWGACKACISDRTKRNRTRINEMQRARRHRQSAA